MYTLLPSLSWTSVYMLCTSPAAAAAAAGLLFSGCSGGLAVACSGTGTAALLLLVCVCLLLSGVLLLRLGVMGPATTLTGPLCAALLLLM
jgi:hypothetical protein